MEFVLGHLHERVNLSRTGSHFAKRRYIIMATSLLTWWVWNQAQRDSPMVSSRSSGRLVRTSACWAIVAAIWTWVLDFFYPKKVPVNDWFRFHFWPLTEIFSQFWKFDSAVPAQLLGLEQLFLFQGKLGVLRRSLSGFGTCVPSSEPRKLAFCWKFATMDGPWRSCRSAQSSQ